jgi:hypothetical protein
MLEGGAGHLKDDDPRQIAPFRGSNTRVASHLPSRANPIIIFYEATPSPSLGTGPRGRAGRIRSFGAQENASLDAQPCTCVLFPRGSEGTDPLQFQGALLFPH